MDLAWQLETRHWMKPQSDSRSLGEDYPRQNVAVLRFGHCAVGGAAARRALSTSPSTAKREPRPRPGAAVRRVVLAARPDGTHTVRETKDVGRRQIRHYAARDSQNRGTAMRRGRAGGARGRDPSR